MAKKPNLESVLAAYKQLVAEAGRQPSLEAVAEKAGISPDQLREFFGATHEMGRKAWADIVVAIQKQLQASETYQNYSAREKMIAYFFALFEALAPDRAFVAVTHADDDLIGEYKLAFRSHMETLVNEGLAMSDLVDRLSTSQYYPDLLWRLHQVLVSFWLDDTSPDYADTERAIEIYSKLPLELMGHNLLDSFIETLTFSFERLHLDRFFR
ncbi:MAG: hypothetical protein SFY70_08140 [Bacteroidia bacterium]|nr:hypothetical protein [Bacteroidia bacterium]